MTVIIRADASVVIGTGHIMRMLVLAGGLRERGFRVVFVCRQHIGHLGALVRGAGYELEWLPATSGAADSSQEQSPYAHWLGAKWDEDAARCRAIALDHGARWVVVDHYALDRRWEMAVASSGARVMVVDDLANRPHSASVLLDQNFGRVSAEYDGLVSADCRRMIGTRYALLRPEFAELREPSLVRRRDPALRRVLVSMGGVDAQDMTGQILQALAQIHGLPKFDLDIVMGAAAPHVEDVRRVAATLPFPSAVSVDVRDMGQRLMHADLAIGAAGISTWERCCLGVPALGVAVADNQRPTLEALARHGALIVLRPQSLVEDLAAFFGVRDLESALSRLSAAAAEVTDGHGADRVADFLASATGLASRK